ncbi:MAG: stage II sporulation protein M [Nitrososphaera sp.]
MLLKSKSRYFSLPLRIGYLVVGALVFVAAYSAGAGVVLSEQDAQDIRSSFLEDIQDIDQAGIFLNNIRVALAMFVPGVGAGIGVYSGISTGMVFNAFALISPELAAIQPLSVLATPFGILEVLAYGLAISRSGMLVAQLVKKDERRGWKRLSMYTGIEIGLVIAALVAGSVIESQLITE